jgi:cellulose synthase/poly-beta-1,6-N-acetylglucosamine synthase-like glycosyltransferase
MATFQVPQFIEEKPKIIGFLTLPQFLYLAAAGGLSFAAFYIFNFFLWIIITIILSGIALSLAFLKIGGQPLPKIIQAAFFFIWQPRKYVWQRAMKEAEYDVSAIEKLEKIRRNMNFQEKLKSITLTITTASKLFSPKAKSEEKKEKYQVVTFATGEKGVAKRVDY